MVKQLKKPENSHSCLPPLQSDVIFLHSEKREFKFESINHEKNQIIGNVPGVCRRFCADGKRDKC